MKINLELEIGAETGVVEAALEEQIKMLTEAAQLGHGNFLLQVAKRIHAQLKQKVNDKLQEESQNARRHD